MLILTGVLSCINDDSEIDNLQNVQAQFCDNYAGAGAAYWNMSNGIFVPLNKVPIIENPGGRVSFNEQPLLSLEYSVGYTGTGIRDSQNFPIGIDIKRLDKKVFYRWIPNVSFVGVSDFNQIIAQEINTMFAEVGYNPSNGFDPICSRNESQNFEGMLVNFNGRVIQFGEFTGIVWVRSMVVPGLGTVNSAIQISAAPSVEFDARTLDTFLPFNFQLYVRPDGEGFIDNDRDGSPAHLDPDDNDPNVRHQN